MSKKLYVGNLPFQAQEETITQTFSAHGNVVSVKIITDRDTGRSKGFGFVEMETEEAAQACIQNLDGQDFDGRPLRISEAREQQPRNNRSR